MLIVSFLLFKCKITAKHLTFYLDVIYIVKGIRKVH